MRYDQCSYKLVKSNTYNVPDGAVVMLIIPVILYI